MYKIASGIGIHRLRETRDNEIANPFVPQIMEVVMAIVPFPLQGEKDGLLGSKDLAAVHNQMGDMAIGVFV
jgi:hypothetical protein